MTPTAHAATRDLAVSGNAVQKPQDSAVETARPAPANPAETPTSSTAPPTQGYLLATKKAGPCKHPGGVFRIRVQLRMGNLAASLSRTALPADIRSRFDGGTMTKTRAQRFVRVAPALLLLLIPLRLAGQQGPSSNWADSVLKQDGYQTPPKELADAVLAPRYLNVTLTNASPDKKWFLDEIGDGPVSMKTFSKPFHELGGVFIDFKANRARALTIRNNVGIQMISAADGTKKPIQLPAGARVSNATWSPDGTVDRLLRPRRGRDPHLDRRRGDGQVAPGDEDAGARDARDQLRLHRRRQADRRGAGARRRAPRCRRRRRRRPARR